MVPRPSHHCVTLLWSGSPVSLVLKWYSISACLRTNANLSICLSLLTGYSMLFPCHVAGVSPSPLIRILYSHAIAPQLRQLRFLRSSVFPSLHALMLILMTNCIPRVRVRDVIPPVAPQPPGHTNWPDYAFAPLP